MNNVSEISNEQAKRDRQLMAENLVELHNLAQATDTIGAVLAEMGIAKGDQDGSVILSSGFHEGNLHSLLRSMGRRQADLIDRVRTRLGLESEPDPTRF